MIGNYPNENEYPLAYSIPDLVGTGLPLKNKFRISFPYVGVDFYVKIVEYHTIDKFIINVLNYKLILQHL